MEAAKAIDAMGSLPGYKVKTGDARGAYTQSLLRGAETWVTLPENRWPKSWKGKYRRPVVRLILALYGHTDAGGFWEEHCEEKLLLVGFVRLAEEWPGVFWHEKTRSMLIVYVDDFKLAAKSEAHDAIWASIREVIDMDPETMDGRFLGCSHERFTTSAGRVSDILDSHPGYHPRPKQGGVALASKEGADPTAEIAKLYDPKRKVEVVSYNMERFAKDCVTAFCELSGYPKAKVGTAPTPFLDESKDPVVIFDDPPTTGSKGKKNKRPKSPVASKEEQAPDKGKGSGKLPTIGKLSTIACKYLMKIMYIARFARPDLLRAVGALSTMITKWDELCDRKLYRIIKYMNGTAAWRQIGFIGDGPDELELGLFSDADFAGDHAQQRAPLVSSSRCTDLTTCSH